MSEGYKIRDQTLRQLPEVFYKNKTFLKIVDCCAKSPAPLIPDRSDMR